MLEGKEVKLTHVGDSWSAWFKVGDIVSIKVIYNDGLKMQAKGYGMFVGWISKDHTDCQGCLTDPTTDSEREMIKMLNPGIEEYLYLS